MTIHKINTLISLQIIKGLLGRKPVSSSKLIDENQSPFYFFTICVHVLLLFALCFTFSTHGQALSAPKARCVSAGLTLCAKALVVSFVRLVLLKVNRISTQHSDKTILLQGFLKHYMYVSYTQY